MSPPEVSNRIDGGIFFHTVIMGRDIRVTLPPEIRPALTGLPRPAAVFTGREEQVEALLDALRPDRAGGPISAVAGMGGIGKTELVVQAAARALREPGWFPGGVLFADLSGYHPERRLPAGDALLGWLLAAGIPGEHIPAAEQDRARLWRSVVDAYAGQDRRLLLIIDNAGSEDQVRPLLPADPRIPVLITSRHTLDLDARLHDLDVLGTAAATALIRAVVAARRGPADPRPDEPLEELAEVCAGLPLALRIVAALLADRPRLRPAALAGRLRDEQGRLDGLSRRQVAVRAAFDLSYRHLTDDEARLFRLLPLNPGPGIATTGAEALADRAEILLEGLHRAHLVTEPEPDRWHLHDLIRLYATSLPPSTPDEIPHARNRLFAHYRDTLHAANSHLDPAEPPDTTRFPGRDAALTWLDAERATLVGVAHDRHLPAVSIAVAFDLARYLHLRRHLPDWLSTAGTALDLSRHAGDRHAEAGACINLGAALQQNRRFDEAVTALTRAQHLFRELGDRRGEARASNNLGLALRYLDRPAEAAAAHTHARDLFQHLGDVHTEATAWNNLGTALQQLHHLDAAIAAHTRARDIFRQTGDLHAEGTAWGNLGRALRKTGRLDAAVTAHTAALDIFRQTADLHAEGIAWNGLGLVLAELGRHPEAAAAHTRDAEINREFGDRHSEQMAYGNLGTALTELGRIDEAVAAHTRALEICRELGDRHAEAIAWDGLGLALAEGERYGESIGAHGTALDLYRTVGDPDGEGRALANLGAALAEVDRFEEARARWSEAVAAFTGAGDLETAALVRGWLDEPQDH